MATLISKKLTYSKQIPQSAYFYKIKDNKEIYKDRYEDAFYVVYKNGMGYIIEKYSGECKC